MGPTALFPLRRKACWGFFRPKNSTAPARCVPANLGTKGQHATSRPPKPRMNKIQPTASSILSITALAYRSICYLFSAVLQGPCFSQRQEIGYCILGVNRVIRGVWDRAGGRECVDTFQCCKIPLTRVSEAELLICSRTMGTATKWLPVDWETFCWCSLSLNMHQLSRLKV